VITIRPCRAGDAELLRRARLRSLRDSPEQFGVTVEEAEEEPATHWEELAAGGSERLALVALDDDSPIGMAVIERERGVRHRHRARVWGVWVSPDYRGRGVGRRLLTALLDWAREEGVVVLYLDVVDGLDPSRSLYRNLGFVRRDVDPHALRLDGRFVAQERLVLLLRRG